MSIYIIRSKEPSLHDIYIGSCEDMRSRVRVHKYNCYNENSHRHNLKVYQYIRANGGWENWEMVQIGSVWNKATKPLFQIEQDYIDNYKPSLNCKRAYRSEEYIKEYKKQNIKQWREKNKDHTLKYDKEYYQKNRDHRLEHAKEHYEKNKDRIREERGEKFNCECGAIYVKRNKARHYKTKKHKSFIENN